MALLHLTYSEPGLPLLRQLRAEAETAALDVRDVPRADVERHLANMETDVAVISPLAFGVRETDLAVLPGACIAAVGATGDTRLHFKSGLRSFDTVAYAGGGGMDLMLARIVLLEKYGMQPEFIRTEGGRSRMLGQADAALIGGEGVEDIGDDSTEEGVIDVVDEWFDMTQLPYVRYIVAGWEHRLDEAIGGVVDRAGEAADREALAEVDRAMHGRSTLTGTDAVPGHYRYRLSEDVFEGLESFFRFAFYHGFHRDIPQFRLWTPGQNER